MTGAAIGPDPGDVARERYRRLRARVASLRDVEADGTHAVRSFPALMEDVFVFFYAPGSPSARTDAATDRFASLVLEYVATSPEYAALRAQTRHDEALASVATAEFARRLVEHLTATGTSATGSAAPPDGQRTATRIVGIRLVERIDAAAAGTVSEEALLLLAKEIAQTLETQRMLSDLGLDWGTEAGRVLQLDPAERIALARQVAASRRLRDLARIVGRFRRVAQRRAHSPVARIPEEVCDVTLGNDPARILPAERVLLAHPMLRYEFYRRFADRRLALYDVRGREAAGEGPIVVCIDTSGSMAGDRELVAKAIGIGLLGIARRRRRGFVAVVFGSRDEVSSFAFEGRSVRLGPAATIATAPIGYLEGLARFAGCAFNGGTDYETPLREAMTWIAADRHPAADIVFITDDYCALSDEFLAEYRRLKQEKRFAAFGVIVGGNAAGARTLRQFCDGVEAAADLTLDVAGRLFETV